MRIRIREVALAAVVALAAAGCFGPTGPEDEAKEDVEEGGGKAGQLAPAPADSFPGI